MSKLIVNSEIEELLKSKRIKKEDGLSYLICQYYNIRPSYIPIELEQKILSLNIFSMDYISNTLKWNLPLFEEQETEFEWISKWMDLFKQINPDRRGVKSDVLKRMKKFFVNNPTVTIDDIFEATKYYLKTINDARFVKKSHKFIYEADNTSMLLDYILIVKDNKKYDNDDLI